MGGITNSSAHGLLQALGSLLGGLRGPYLVPVIKLELLITRQVTSLLYYLSGPIVTLE